MSPDFKPDRRDQLLLALEKIDSVHTVDCEYWPDEPEVDPTSFTRSYFMYPSLSMKMEAAAQMLAAAGYHVGDPHHQHHQHTYYRRSATGEQLAALESIARGDTVEEWNIIRNRLNPNQNYPGKDKTKRKHNKHLGKGKRKR